VRRPASGCDHCTPPLQARYMPFPVHAACPLYVGRGPSEGASVAPQLAIEWTVDSTPTTLQHVCIDHRCFDVGMSHVLLNLPDVHAVEQQVGPEAVTTMPDAA